MKLRRTAPHRPDTEQRILPLINIVFLLLIFFMVAGQLSRTDAIKVDPPVSDSPGELENPSAPVLVRADGRVFVYGRKVPVDGLATALAAQGAGGVPRIVHVKADASVDAAVLIDILHRIEAAGTKSVRLVTAHRRER